MKCIIGLLVLGIMMLGCAPAMEAQPENVAETEQAVVMDVYKINATTNQIENYEVWDPRPTDDAQYLWRTLDEVTVARYPGTEQVVGMDFDLYWYYRDVDENADPPRMTAECQDSPF